MGQVETFIHLLLGSMIHRPYVYVFFACFLVFATYHLGWKRMLTFLTSTYLITFACEFSSTRNGFPFGPYTYVDTTRSRELWLSNVPFWDSLSFVFLSYFSLVMAAAILTRDQDLSRGDWPGLRRPLTPFLGGLIMMLLDVVIDPVTLQGDKWFLGQIYQYPYRGFYFGVTAANFAGWFFVGLATQWTFQRLLQHAPWCRGPWRPLRSRFIWGVYAVYAGIFAFNLGVTLLIGDYKLAAASACVSSAALIWILLSLRRKGRLAWKS